MSDYFLAEFKGTYRAPHPGGLRDQNVTKDFHVRVKMRRECLEAPGLNGLFANYYKEFLRKQYPDMIDTYMFDLVQATELDGSVIDNPKALSYQRLVQYVTRRRLPVNTALYSPTELRNEVVLYEQDPKGQQHLQALLETRKGSTIAISAELQELDDVLVVVDPNEDDSESDDVEDSEASLEDLLSGAAVAQPKPKSKSRAKSAAKAK